MILKKVQDAILAVLGTAIGADEPLVNAGLDSLGEQFLCIVIPYYHQFICLLPTATFVVLIIYNCHKVQEMYYFSAHSTAECK